jgi:hypothetical protein
LRYLIQRLRHRLPRGAQIIVGIWQSEDVAQRDDAARKTIGASALAASLEGTVTLCVQTAIKAADNEPRPPTVPLPSPMTKIRSPRLPVNHFIKLKTAATPVDVS